MNYKYSYNDISIVPARISEVISRSQCNPYVDVEDKYLPIFTAPMSTIVSESNYDVFTENYITAILPRNVEYSVRIKAIKESKWVALSLKEFYNIFISNEESLDNNAAYNVCIDVANGHMKVLLSYIQQAKEKFNGLKVMTGNIANPKTIKDYVLSGVDYARLSIGSGAGCITTSNTGIHYPIASLIEETKMIQEEFLQSHRFYHKVNLVADGGIRNYSDVIKALALGADYVMIGGLFAQCEEACGTVIEREGKKYHQFYGMASAQGQIDLNGGKTKTAEGISKEIEIKYNLPTWTDNMISYLRSAMSYCNAFTLEDFKKNVKCIVISNNAKLAINN